MSEQQKKDKLYWVATTGEYGSNHCIHVDLSSWTDEQWELFDTEIAEQDRYAFIERWRNENKQPDWADAIGLVQEAINYLQEDYDKISEPETEPAEAGIAVAIDLLKEWLEHVKLQRAEPLLPYHYDTKADEVPTFEELESGEW